MEPISWMIVIGSINHSNYVFVNNRAQSTDIFHTRALISILNMFSLKLISVKNYVQTGDYTFQNKANVI